MQKTAPPIPIPDLYDPDHIERTIANSNELMRMFAAKNLDGVLRVSTEVIRHSRGRLLRGE